MADAGLDRARAAAAHTHPPGAQRGRRDPGGARRFHEAVEVDKTIAWVAGTQFEFYDQQAVVSDAVERSVVHFRRYA